MISKYGKECVNEIVDGCYPIEVVKDRLLGLDHLLIDMLDSNTTKIRNIKAYIISSLFNAKATIANFYNNQVNYHFNQNC